jgi:hypothetical protein
VKATEIASGLSSVWRLSLRRSRRAVLRRSFLAGRFTGTKTMRIASRDGESSTEPTFSLALTRLTCRSYMVRLAEVPLVPYGRLAQCLAADQRARCLRG